MAFPSAATSQISPVGAGEVFGQIGVISSYTIFEEGIEAGKFVKFNSDTGGIEKVNGESGAIIAGVAKRNVTDAVENYGVFTRELTSKVDVVESGIVTVEVVAGINPKKFDKVYVYNNTDVATDEWGKATNHSSDLASDGTTEVENIPIDGYFYKKISDNVWAIRIK